MAKSAADKILDAALKNQINILKLSASEQLKAEKLLINLQQKTLNALLSKITRTAFQKKRTEDLYKAVKNITDESFSAMSASSQRALLKMGEYEVEATAAMINGSIGVDVITPTLTISNVQSIVNKSMIEGELMKDWWSKQADDFIKRFKGTMNGIMKEFQAGMIEGRTIGQMISAISPSGRLMGYTRRNVEAMVRTSFMQVASDVRQKMYEQNSDILQGTRWVSTLDMRTTQLCMALDGSMWDMEGKPVGNTAMPYRRPPAHWNCFIDGQVKIYTSDGWKQISKIKVDDLVLTHKGRFRKVTSLIQSSDTPKVYKIFIKNFEALTVTSGHPVLVGDDWVDIKDIKVGDKVKYLAVKCKYCDEHIHHNRTMCSKRECRVKRFSKKQLSNTEIVIRRLNRILNNHDGNYAFMDAEVISIESWTIKKTKRLYNFSVEEDESYIAKGFVVHNCRSTTVPVTLTFDQLLKKKSEMKSLSPGQRAAMDGPVSKSMDYGDWLKSLPKKDQVEILGKAKQELWEKGRLSLVDMIRKDGSPLTIKELRAKINKAL